MQVFIGLSGIKVMCEKGKEDFRYFFPYKNGAFLFGRSCDVLDKTTWTSNDGHVYNEFILQFYDLREYASYTQFARETRDVLRKVGDIEKMSFETVSNMVRVVYGKTDKNRGTVIGRFYRKPLTIYAC